MLSGTIPCLDIFFSGSIRSSFLSVLPDPCCEPLVSVKIRHVTWLQSGPMKLRHLYHMPTKPFFKERGPGKTT